MFREPHAPLNFSVCVCVCVSCRRAHPHRNGPAGAAQQTSLPLPAAASPTGGPSCLDPSRFALRPDRAAGFPLFHTCVRPPQGIVALLNASGAAILYRSNITRIGLVRHDAPTRPLTPLACPLPPLGHPTREACLATATTAPCLFSTTWVSPHLRA